jgi:hypothetical protein
VDRRPTVRPAVVADARALPFRDAEAAGPLAFRWAIADPPYSREWARTLYGITARQYPTPGGIVTEAMRVLAPGGRLGLLHYMVPPYSTRVARLVGVWGITIGPGSMIRAWTVLEKVAAPALPLLEPTGASYGGPPYTGPGRPLLDVLTDDLVADDHGPVRPAVRQLEPADLGSVTESYGSSGTQAPVQALSSLPCVCGCGELVEQASTGRPRLYAGPAHRQRAYRRRRAS